MLKIVCCYALASLILSAKAQQQAKIVIQVTVWAILIFYSAKISTSIPNTSPNSTNISA